MDREFVHLDIIIIYKVDATDDVLEDIFSSGFPYYKYWKNDQ